MKKRVSILMAMTAALVACGTPQEQCIRSQTRELRTVDRLIAETRSNLARGYAYETQEITRTEWVICDYIDVPPSKPGGAKPPPKPRYCLDDVTETVRKAVAIDPAAERRKLAGLTDRRSVLNRQAVAAIEQCRAQYPEGA